MLMLENNVMIKQQRKLLWKETKPKYTEDLIV